MLEWIISSSALILLVLLVRALGKSRLSCRVRYALWLLVLVRLLVPVQLLETGWGVTAPLPERLTEPSIYVLPVSREEGIPVEHSREVRDPFAADSFGYSRQSGTAFIKYADKWSVADILHMIWLAGAGLLATVLLCSNLRFARRLKRSRVSYDAPCGGMRVYVAEGLASPCLVGVFRPSVYLTPESIRNERTLRHVLAHEETHRRHGDCVWSLLRLAALCLHWYNPLVWYAAIVSKRDGELKGSDEMAVEFSINPGEAEKNNTEAMRIFQEQANGVWSCSRLLFTTDQEVLSHLYDADTGEPVATNGSYYIAARDETVRYRETMTRFRTVRPQSADDLSAGV